MAALTVMAGAPAGNELTSFWIDEMGGIFSESKAF